MLAEEQGGTSPETNWPERFHHLQMKCMTPSVAASQCSSAAALARGLHVDVILPVETHPKTLFKTEWNRFGPPALRRTSFFQAHATFRSPAPDLGHCRGQVVSPGGYALDLQGRLRQMVCVKGHRRQCQDFQAQFLRLGREGKR